MITGYTFAPAHCDERDVAPEITQDIQGLLGGDKGYLRPELKHYFMYQDIDLQTEPYRVCRRVNILRDYPDDKIKIYP